MILGSVGALRAASYIVAGSLVLASHSANAALTLRLNDGVNPVQQVVDLDADGIVNFTGSLGVWFLNVSTGISKPALPGAQTDLNSVNLSQSAGTLIISLSDDNFSLGGSTGFGLFEIGGTTQGTVAYESWIDVGNTLFATTTLIGSDSAGPGAFADTLGSGLLLSNPFSMTTIVTITHGGGTGVVTSFNANTRVSVPEPTTLTLLGGGLLALGFFARRLRRRPQPSRKMVL